MYFYRTLLYTNMQKHNIIWSAAIASLTNSLYTGCFSTKCRSGILHAGLSCFFLLLALGVQAQNGHKLNASDAAIADEFGRAVAVSGNLAIVGAPRNDSMGVNAGAAFIYEYDAANDVWTEAAGLYPTDAGLYDEFGGAVSIDSNRAVVGSMSHAGTGAVYVFEKINDSTWAQTAKLLAADAAMGDKFGGKVALDGDRIMVAAKGDNSIYGYDQGAVYMFTFQADSGRWEQEAKIIPLAAGIVFEFGTAIDLSGTDAIVSATYDNTGGLANSSVYLFSLENGRWMQQGRLSSPSAQLGDLFGSAVAIEGNRAVVGAYLDDTDAQDAGSVFVFQRDSTGWQETARLGAQDASVKAFMGISVALSGNRIIAGASGVDIKDSTNTTSDVGAAYVFEYQDSTASWSQSSKWMAADANAFDQFGAAVAIDGTTLLAGAAGDDEKGSNSGAAYAIAQPSGLNIDLGDDQVVYIGFPPASCTTLEVTGAPEGSVFAWSTGDTTASIEVCPTATSTYSVTVIDPAGNTATDEVQVCVLDIRCNTTQSNPYVTICFESFITPGQFNTYCVPAIYVPTYLAYGASLGDCNADPCAPPEQAEEAANRRAAMTPDLLLDASPNPFAEQVSILFKVPQGGRAKLEIFDLAGKRLATLFEGNIEGGQIYEQSWNASQLVPGVYIYRLSTERITLTRKIVRSR